MTNHLSKDGRQAAILVGGRGTRLGTITDDCPKPMISVGGRPFLEYLVANIARHGFTDILLLAGYLPEQLQALEARGSELGCRIRCIIEPSPAGTAGALLHARDHLADEFLLLNGDSFLDINYLDLCLSCAAPRDILGAIALRRMGDTGRYGRVEMHNGCVTNFAEKSASGPGLINGGIYWLKKSILERITQTPCSLEAHILPHLARSGHLSGRAYDSFFIDIGIPEDLERAQMLIPAQMRRPALFLDRDGVINHDIGYAHRPDQIKWIDGAADTIKMYNDAGWFVFVVTNQAGIARGLYDETMLQALHQWMARELEKTGAHIDDWRYCPYHIDGIIPELSRPHDWRKPAPGMITDLLANWPVDAERSFLIGDKMSDIQAAEAAGLPGALFTGGSLSEFAGPLMNGIFHETAHECRAAVSR